MLIFYIHLTLLQFYNTRLHYMTPLRSFQLFTPYLFIYIHVLFCYTFKPQMFIVHCFCSASFSTSSVALCAALGGLAILTVVTFIMYLRIRRLNIKGNSYSLVKRIIDKLPNLSHTWWKKKFSLWNAIMLMKFKFSFTENDTRKLSRLVTLKCLRYWLWIVVMLSLFSCSNRPPKIQTFLS